MAIVAWVLAVVGAILLLSVGYCAWLFLQLDNEEP